MTQLLIRVLTFHYKRKKIEDSQIPMVAEWLALNGDEGQVILNKFIYSENLAKSSYRKIIIEGLENARDLTKDYRKVTGIV